VSNEVVITSGKTIKMGEVDWVIVDPGLPTVLPSVILEHRQVNGVLYLSLGETIVDAGNSPEVRVCARLRLDSVMMQVLRNLLTGTIEEMQKPTDKSQAN